MALSYLLKQGKKGYLPSIVFADMQMWQGGQELSVIPAQ
jgi:hypothetical protein